MIDHARRRRSDATTSEGLLWSLHRGKQLCGPKFQREHPVGSYIADFACVTEQLVVEIDGGYHDENAEADLQRQEAIERLGWRIIRFTDQEVEQDAEAVCRALASFLGIPYDFQERSRNGSGFRSVHASPVKRRREG
ncbi:endonuclease domain-containing protein [Crateriforma conspicua]|uniref:endonuclease domain-containing protein n=1 Tax=Crateriforma conspicua TaxID=2527996 RepID=UPI0011A33FC1